MGMGLFFGFLLASRPVSSEAPLCVCVCVDNLSARTLGILHILPCGVCVLESLLIIYSQAVKSKLPSASL